MDHKHCAVCPLDLKQIEKIKRELDATKRYIIKEIETFVENLGVDMGENSPSEKAPKCEGIKPVCQMQPVDEQIERLDMYRRYIINELDSIIEKLNIPTAENPNQFLATDSEGNPVWESKPDLGSMIVTGIIEALKHDNYKGEDGSDGVDGKNGVDGKDGFSPTVSLEREGRSVKITVTDKNGTHTETINDGVDPIPEGSSPNMYLCTDKNGNPVLEKKINLKNGLNADTLYSTSSPEIYGQGVFGPHSFAHGLATTVYGGGAHSEGLETKANGDYSHSEGIGTIANGEGQHVEGKYNVPDDNGKYLHIVGNGENSLNRKNAYTLDKNGNAWFRGKVFVGGNSQDEGTELGLGGGGGTGAPSDWNANEGEAGYVKNRTHWVENGEGFVLEETTLLKSDGMYLSFDPLNSVIADGENYKVTYNGTEYNCTGKNVETEGIIMPVLGNLAILEYGDDTGEPFIFVFPSPEISAVAFQGATIMGMDTSSDEGCFLSIKGKTMLTHELDGKFVKTAIANALKYYLHILPNDRFNVGEILYVGEWWDDGTPVVRSQPIVDAISTFYPITDTTKGLVYSFNNYTSTKTSVFFETTDYNVDLTGVGVKSIILASSTPNSRKRFRITVDDSGTISATEYNP